MAGNRAMNETNFVEKPKIFCDNYFRYAEDVCSNIEYLNVTLNIQLLY
jgi:hypothetical protein